MDTVIKKIEQYNQVWHTVGETDRSSMPIGNGEMGANVWTTKNGIRMYFSTSDSIDNYGRNLKYGMIKINVTPNIFDGCDEFTQKLNLLESSVEITAKKDDVSLMVKIFIGRDDNTIYVKGSSDKALNVSAEYFNWRDCTSDEKCDFIESYNGGILFYYKAKKSCVEDVAKLHAVGDCIDKIYDPFKDRIFGGYMKLENSNISNTNNNTATVTLNVPQKFFEIKIATASTQESDIAKFKNELILNYAKASDYSDALKISKQWWENYWTSSWIFVEGDEPKKRKIKSEVFENLSFESKTEYENADSNITRAYVLTKYMFACNAYGKFPLYFNGLLFNTMPGAGMGYDKYNESHTAQPLGKPDTRLNPDARSWSCNVIWQNVRLPYYSMLARNEIESIKVLFAFYRRFWDINKIKAKRYYDAEGQFSTEINMFCGLMHPWIYGEDRDGKPDGYSQNRWGGAVDISPGLELAYFMINYYNHTHDKEFLYDEALPYVKDILLYTSTRFKERDENGKIILYPLNCIETFWDTKNPITVVCGMRAVINAVLELGDIVEDIEFYRNMLEMTPDIPTETVDGKAIMMPAWEYDDKTNNVEHCAFYAMYPFENHTKFEGDLELAKNTYYNSLRDREKVFKPRAIGEPLSEPSYSGWQYIGMTAAMLGISDDAAEILSENAVISNPGYRFPAMWGPIYDAVPDVDHGSNILNTLQLMLFKVHKGKIYLFPSWKKEWNVSFKLYADKDTTVTCEYKNGEIVKLDVVPKSRECDVVIM